MLEKIPTSLPKEDRVEKIVTHGGWFHADEVFATAVLKDLFPESMELKEGGKLAYVKYVRNRDPKFLAKSKGDSSTMLLDVGESYYPEDFNFDHHQVEGAGHRENGVEYAAAGLVWKHYGREWVKYVDIYSRKLGLTNDEIELIWKEIDEKYIQFFDSNDTGQMVDFSYSLDSGEKLSGNQFTIPEIVRLARIDTHDGRTMDDKFGEMVEFFRTMNLSLVHKYINIVESLREFKVEDCEFSNNGRTVLINQSISPDALNHIVYNMPEFKDVEFYAALSNRGQYNINVVAAGEGHRIYRNPDRIPEGLRLGNNANEINKLLNLDYGIRFVHTSGFSAKTTTLEAARVFLDYCVSH
jgi:uncharacterized UPF0160 family protein